MSGNVNVMEYTGIQNQNQGNQGIINKKAKSDFERRMREYEAVSDTRLFKNTPVIIRVDGRSFKRFTKGLEKPFDYIFRMAMINTMVDMCKEMEGTVFGYTQSDEISLVLIDYKTVEQSALFDYRVQKLCGSASAMATRYFNKHFMELAEVYTKFNGNIQMVGTGYTQNTAYYFENADKYASKFFKADFVAKAFNMSKEEVVNNLYWRQSDAIRNSVQSVARAYFSQRQLNGLNTNQMKEKLVNEAGVDWGKYPRFYTIGAACKRDGTGTWQVDLNMPILSENRDYLEKLVIF